MIGPYRFVRHPFYLANALIDMGLVVMAGWWPLAVVLPLWWLTIYIPVIRGEERYLSENFPDEYPDYRQRVPCLIPWRRPLHYTGEGFHWSNPNIAGGEELPRVVRILAYPLLFLVVERLAQFGLIWLNNGWNLTGFTGLIMFYVLAWELHGHQRQQRWILPATMRHPILRIAMSAVVLAAVCYIPGPRTSFRDYVPLGGALLLLLSVPVFSRRPVRVLVAETLTLLGMLAAGELLWLAPALVVIYVAWILDSHLASVHQTFRTASRSDAIFPMPFWPYFYPVLAVASAAVIGVKLIGHGLPCHTVMF